MFDEHLLTNCMIRLSVLLLIGWALLWIVHRRDPRWSVFVTRAMTVACFVLPVMCLFSPGINLAILPMRTPAINSAQVEVAASPFPMIEKQRLSPHASEPSNAEPMAVDAGPSQNSEQTQIQLANRPRVTASDLLEGSELPIAGQNRLNGGFSAQLVVFAIWFTVCFGLLLRVAVQLLSAHRLISSSRPPEETELDRVAQLDVEAAKQQADIRITDELDCPCTGGLLRPVILLPGSWFHERSDQQLRAILAHEQAHVEGHDLAWDLLCRLAMAVLWFHPLVWFLQNRHRLACELVSDAIAGRSVNDFSLYRRWLARWTISRQAFASQSRSVTAGTFAMADQSLMMRRLGWLKRGRSSVRPSRLQTLSLSLLAIFLVSTIASLNLTEVVIAAPPQKAADSESSSAADRDSSEPTKDQGRTKTIVVRIINQDGGPISNASVAVGRWEYSDESSVSMSMDKPLTANEKGEVSFDAPEDAVKAIFWATADGYAEDSGYVSLADIVTLELKRGRRIRVRVVDEDGSAVPSAIPILENESRWPTEFDPMVKSPGVFLSRAVSAERKSMFVIDKTRDVDGKILYRFSDWIDSKEISCRPRSSADMFIYDGLERPLPVDRNGSCDCEKPIKCPRCGGRPVATIFYGMPVPSDNLHRRLSEEKVVLGGCVISGDDPVWQCSRCDLETFRNS